MHKCEWEIKVINNSKVEILIKCGDKRKMWVYEKNDSNPRDDISKIQGIFRRGPIVTRFCKTENENKDATTVTL